MASNATEHPKIAIIGGGAAAMEFIIRLWQSLGQEHVISLVIFEPRDRLWRGLAWSPEDTPVLANMRVETLGPTPTEILEIQKLLTDIGHPEATAEYPSRNAVGDALDERWKQVEKPLRKHWAFQHIKDCVVDIDRSVENSREQFKDNITVYLQKHAPHREFTHCVLALGNLSEKKPEHLATHKIFRGTSPSDIANIPNDADVLIRGMGLTSIDVTHRLLEQGHSRKKGSIVWHSRSGLLPYVRPKQVTGISQGFFEIDSIASKVNDLRNRGKYLSLENIYRLLALEMNRLANKHNMAFSHGTDLKGFLMLYGKAKKPQNGLAVLKYGVQNEQSRSLWFTALKFLDEYTIPWIWNSLSDSEKVKFLQRYRRDFDRFWAPIPSKNGRKIIDWIESNTIQLAMARSGYCMANNGSTISIEKPFEDPLGFKTKAQLRKRYQRGFDYLVDGVGIASDLEKVDSSLVQTLLRKRYITPLCLRSRDGGYLRLGAKIEAATGDVIAEDSNAHGWLYCLAGSMTTGAHRFTNSYMAASVSAAKAVNALVERLTE